MSCIIPALFRLLQICCCSAK